MFNDIEWLAELPGPSRPDELGWQTKALGELNMDRYTVTPEGRLYKREFDWHDTGRWYKFGEADGIKTRLEFDEKPEDDGGIFGPYPIMERASERYTFVPFTGEFNFYSGKRDDGWLEYVATFEEGKLMEVYRDTDREWRMENMRKRKR